MNRLAVLAAGALAILSAAPALTVEQGDRAPAWQAVDPMIVMQGFNGGGGLTKETVEQLMERRRMELMRTGS